ncbi:MAG: acyltransferase domain-containing protein [Planctomycetes bacterium]|nr:acyltransferase domain-containing protein [Planctomycetota bacterium]
MSNISKRLEQLSPAQQMLFALKEAQAKLEVSEKAKNEPIAVIGMSCRFPGEANNTHAFWELLCNSVDAVTEIPPERWDVDAFYDPDPEKPGKMYTRYGGFLSQIDQFDPRFFGISPREAASIDPQQRLLLEVSWEALENAGMTPDRRIGNRTGVYIGITSNDYMRLLLQQNDHSLMDTFFITGNALNAAAGRISYVLGLQGPSMALDTACSSSLVAIHLACQSIRNQECEQAIVGGVNLILAPDIAISSSRAKMLAPDGRCKTFDAAADGYIRGEGCGVILIKRLSQAQADNDNILAVIRGSSVNQDGPSSGLTAPNGVAQQALIRQALANAQVKPNEVSYVEAHGTGTSLGDPIEVGALGEVYSEERSFNQPLMIGSVKTNVGHLESAAGMAGLIKVILSLQHKEIPPHLHFKQPSTHIPWDQWPIQVVTEKTPWPVINKRRIAGVSSFGVSGTNAHIVLEGAERYRISPDPDTKGPQPAVRPRHLLTLSAQTSEALKQLAERYENHLSEHPNLALEDICFSANVGRSHFDHRLGVVAESLKTVRDLLRTFVNGRESIGIFQGKVPRNRQRKIAFLFTNQGDQYIGMGQQLYQTQPTFRKIIDHCNGILCDYLEGPPLINILYPALDVESRRKHSQPKVESEKGLDVIVYQQSAFFTLEYALAGLWKSWGIEPGIATGGSVGEYVAACVAGVFSVEEGIKLAVERGRLMSSQKGNYEPKPSQIAFQKPRIPLVSNVTGQLLSPKQALDANYWKQYHNVESEVLNTGINTLIEQGYELFLELGTASSLMNTGQQHQPPIVWLSSLVSAGDDWQGLLESLSTLYIQGSDINWKGFDIDYPRNRVSLPTYPFQRQRCWFKSQELPIEKRQVVETPGSTTQQHQTQNTLSNQQPGVEELTRIMRQQQLSLTNVISNVISRQLAFLRDNDLVQPQSTTPSSDDNGGIKAFQAPVDVLLPKNNWQLLVLSAETESGLERATSNLVEHMRLHPDLNLAEIAYTLQTNRKTFNYKRMAVCSDVNDAIKVFDPLDKKRVATRCRESANCPVAFLFSGVGDHYVNMARGLYQTETVFREQVDKCCEILLPYLKEDLREILYPTDQKSDETAKPGFDLRKMLNRGQAPVDATTQKLNKTIFLQPAIFVIGYSLAKLWHRMGVSPQAMIGYSLGEYVAAAVAEVMSLEDALLLVVKRAQMIEELPEGAMLAAPLSENEMLPLLGDELSLATISTPSQCVVSGPPDAIMDLEQHLKEKEILHLRLQTSHAFHSKMMKKLSGPLTELAKIITFKSPGIPYISNVTGDWITNEQATDPHYWARHTYNTVRFADGVSKLLREPERIMLEVGPGQSLGSFVFQHPDIKNRKNTVALPSLRNVNEQQSDEAFLLNSLGKLWLEGVKVKWPKLR